MNHILAPVKATTSTVWKPSEHRDISAHVDTRLRQDTLPDLETHEADCVETVAYG